MIRTRIGACITLGPWNVIRATNRPSHSSIGRGAAASAPPLRTRSLSRSARSPNGPNSMVSPSYATTSLSAQTSLLATTRSLSTRGGGVGGKASAACAGGCGGGALTTGRSAPYVTRHTASSQAVSLPATPGGPGQGALAGPRRRSRGCYAAGLVRLHPRHAQGSRPGVVQERHRGRPAPTPAAGRSVRATGVSVRVPAQADTTSPRPAGPRRFPCKGVSSGTAGTSATKFAPVCRSSPRCFWSECLLHSWPSSRVREGAVEVGRPLLELNQPCYTTR